MKKITNVKDMKLPTLGAASVLLLFLSLALIAQANHKQITIETKQITFDSKSRTYHPTSSIPFLSLPIEQKYMAIKSINAFEDRLETDDLINSQ